MWVHSYPSCPANRDVSSALTQSCFSQVFMAGYVSCMKNGFVFCMPFFFFPRCSSFYTECPLVLIFTLAAVLLINSLT